MEEDITYFLDTFESEVVSPRLEQLPHLVKLFASYSEQLSLALDDASGVASVNEGVERIVKDALSSYENLKRQSSPAFAVAAFEALRVMKAEELQLREIKMELASQFQGFMISAFNVAAEEELAFKKRGHLGRAAEEKEKSFHQFFRLHRSQILQSVRGARYLCGAALLLLDPFLIV